MENRTLRYDHKTQDYIDRDTDDYLSFYGVVRDNDAVSVDGAVVMVFACFADGSERKLDYTITNGEGAYFLCLPKMSDHTRLTGFKVRAGKANIFPEEYIQPAEPVKEPDIDPEQNAAPKEYSEKQYVPESEENMENAEVATFLTVPKDEDKKPASKSGDTLALGSTLTVAPPAVQAGAVTIKRPEAPKGLTVVATNHRRIDLSWNAVPGATAYKVYRSRFQAGVGTLIGTSKETTFSDKNLMGTAGCSYNWYKVTAVNSAGEGGFSREASIVSKPYSGPFFW